MTKEKTSILCGIESLNELQKKIVRTLSAKRFINLRALASKIEMSPNHVRVQVRELEGLGFLAVAKPVYYNSPLKLKLNSAGAALVPSFDELLFCTRWV